MDSKQKERERIYLEEQKFSENFAQSLIARFSGTGTTTVLGGRPSQEHFFIGTLMPHRPSRKGPEKANPVEVGLEFLVPQEVPKDSFIEIEFTGSYFYRVFPTLEQQLTRQVSSGLVESPEGMEEQDPEADLPSSDNTLKKAWKKAGPFRITARIPASSLSTERTHNIAEGAEIALRARTVWEKDPNRYREKIFKEKRKLAQHEELTVDKDALSSNEAFQSYLERSYRGAIKEPDWRVKARIIVDSPNHGKRRLAVQLENSCVEEKSPPDSIDNTLFESGIVIRSIGFDLIPFTLDRLKDGYRYEGRVPAAGINCFADGSASLPLREVWVCHAPLIPQKKLVANNFYATLEELADNPIQHLEKLQTDMKTYGAELRKVFERTKGEYTDQGQTLFERDVEQFEEEFNRFSEGLRVLAEVPESLEAFRLTNLSFKESNKGFTTWRLFQVVFLVCQIPDMVAPRFPQYKNFRDKVDVIYFPTGGGKTETYLSCVVFQMFFDRLMGKKCGVSAITRFPLRLLSLQQIQRIAFVFGAAEKIRRRHPEIGKEGYDPFSTGYFVGDDNTPNRLFKRGYNGEDDVDHITPIVEDPRVGAKFKIIEECPFCGKRTVEISASKERMRIELKCSSCLELIPVYLSDDEIYRYLPTFIIGTVDKMAAAGWNINFRHIFGQVTHICPDHGFLSGAYCLYGGNQRLCERTPEEYEKVTLLDPTPSLIIQDEMHLIRETLGCYDSHYETFLDTLENEISGGKKRLKVIGASATVSEPESQLYHLYMRNGSIFPCRGPDRKVSFYYVERQDMVSRFIIGVLPHNKTIIYAIQDILLYHALMVRIWEGDVDQLVENGFFLSGKDAADALSNYSVAVSYNTMKMQVDAVASAARKILSPQLNEWGLRGIKVQSLTGDVTFERVKRVLELLERREGPRDVDLITATSMISHGVDIDALNFMVFMGVPTSTAEYVQAYSRVGRNHPGVVVVVFNHARERDTSHYRYFSNYHNLSDLLIEPVPINRWAKNSIERTLPGIFCASVMAYFEPIVQKKKGVKRKLYMSDGFTDSINDRSVTEEEILAFIKKCYRDDDPMGLQFSEAIRSGVHRYINELTRPLKGTFISGALSTPPLISLRDTDVQVIVKTNAESFTPMSKVSAAIRGVDDQ